MDASKLLNVLIDIDNEHDATTQLLQDLVTSLSTNDETHTNKLYEDFATATKKEQIFHYPPSNIEILKFIGGYHFFGSPLLQRIEQIIINDSYSQQSKITELSNHLDSRNKFISTVATTVTGLEGLNVEPHFFSKSIFEVGLLMPSEVTDNKITSVTKELIQWDKVFKDFKELVGESREDTTLDFISNGSLQFFIENSATVGVCLAVTLERILKLYKNILDISAARKQLKALGVETNEIKNIERQEKDKLDQGLEKIAADIIKEYAVGTGDNGRMNELTIAIRGQVRYIARCMDKGMVVEIIPPETNEPVVQENATEEDKAAHKAALAAHKTVKKQIEIVEKSMEIVKQLSDIGGNFTKYLSSSENTKENER